MNLSQSDRALAESFAGPTPFEPANDAALLFHLTIRQYDGTLISEAVRFVDSTEAAEYGMVRGGLGSRVTVRPDVETSYLHGRARFPNQLHKMASLDAIEGWAAAASSDYARRKQHANDCSAMALQLRTAGTDNLLVRS